ncbi:type II secretion system F family protein [Candidatus Parcubacteria bacterium]|nr:type II secretion system F family protein [Candidatus Parcubacteria bacterium]MBI4385325.1 type II secretion system F family protein [Candidatus Parcubacteria bacterium]
MLFFYTARTSGGQMQTGTIEAASPDIGVELLQQHGLVVISLRVQGASIFDTPLKLFNRVKKKEIVIFSRQLSTLLDAEVPITESLRTLMEQTGSATFRGVLFEISADVEGGMSMSKAFQKHPQVFSDFFVTLVKSGEISGRLQEVFAYLASYLEREHELASKARRATVYPAVVLFAFLVVAVIMLVFVVPQLTLILTESEVELPFLTRLLIGTSSFLQSWGWLVGIGAVAGVVLLVRYARTAEGKEFFDRLILRLPGFGNLFKKMYLARFAETLSTMIVGGIPIVQALEVTGDVVGNTVYRAILSEVMEAVRRGEMMSGVLHSHHPTIPLLVTQMMSVGEKSGRLDSILRKLADFYRREVESLVENLTNLIEPILILVLGGGVGVLIAAVLLPIYNLASAIK